MKTLNLAFAEKGFQRAPEDKDKTAQEITCIVVQNVVHNYAQQKGGFTQQERILWYKIEDKLRDALEKKPESIEFEDEQFGMIRKCFQNVKLAPNLLVRKLDELIEAVPMR